jgi:FKBP-type peptidyl-prolyl cis-trans isomerase
MRKTILTALLSLASAGMMQAQEGKGAAAVPAEPTASDVGYALGCLIGKNISSQGLKPDFEALVKGLKETMEGKKPTLSDQQLQETIQKHQMAAAAAAGPKNTEAGKAFLDKNGKREGVKTTASGLQYEVLKAGEGAKPAATDTVKVHYHGTLIDGTVFDSSVDRGEPISFPLNRVIKGWTEGVQLMPVGSKYKFVIPSDLAYGAQGAGGKIGPNATLIFEVELLAIEPAAAN